MQMLPDGRPSGSLIDYIAVSGTMERNELEYVDHCTKISFIHVP
jgi:hypothetical protein